MDNESTAESLRRRFPALERLERRRSRRSVPFVPQLQSADCGAACLTMVLRYLGHDVRADDVRRRVGAGRDGTTALALADAARTYGLQARAVRIEVEDLAYLDPAAILHWRMQHFVVLSRVRRHGIDIVDPAMGRRRCSRDEVARSFTGVALTFERTDLFTANSAGRSRVWQYMRAMAQHSRALGRILMLSVFAQVLGLALPLMTGAVVDRVVPNQDFGLLSILVVGMAMLGVFGFFNSFLRAQLLLQMQTNIDLRMTLGFLDHMLRLPFSFFLARQPGDLMMRLNSNSSIRDILTSTALSGLLDGVMVFAYLILMLFTNAKLALVIVGLGLLRIAVYVATRRRFRELMTTGLEAQANSSNFQVQMLAGIETLKAAGAEGLALSHWSNLLVETMNVSLSRGKLNAVVQSLLGALGSFSALVMLFYGANLVIDGNLSLGTMLAVTALGAGFLGPLSSLVSTALSLQSLGSLLERVEDVLETPPEYEPGSLGATPSLTGELEVQGLSFRYDDAGSLVVDDVSVRISAGMMVGIVGPSGSGKSTLARLLAGLYQPGKGEILYDGRPIGTLDLPSLRRQLGFVPQNPFIFATSIRHNIALAHPDMSLDDIESAARLAAIDGDIREMPLRYDTMILAGGASLSGGQRQRIALARALAGHPAVLVLDESTSHLDSLLEMRVHDNLRAMRCTRIVIAHRLSTIAAADLILCMDHGRVIERGTHEELIGAGGLYARMVAAQRQDPRRVHL